MCLVSIDFCLYRDKIWCDVVTMDVGTVLKIGLIGRLILFGDNPLNITLIALIMRSGD